jgi:hypothetical protein
MSGEAYLSDDGDAICERSDLPMAWCSHCKGLDKPKPNYRPQHVPLGPWETAAEPGECCRCGRAFRVRATVRWDFDDEGWIFNNCCKHARPRRKRTVA